MVKRIAFTDELPEIGDVPNSPLTKNGSLMPIGRHEQAEESKPGSRRLKS